MRRLIFFIFKPQSKILNVFSQYRMTFTQHTGVTMSVLVLEIRTLQYFDTAEASGSFSAAERRVEFHWLDSPCPEIHTTLWTSSILIIDNKAGVNFLWGFCGPWGVDFWMVAVRCCDTRTHTHVASKEWAYVIGTTNTEIYTHPSKEDHRQRMAWAGGKRGVFSLLFPSSIFWYI